MKNVTEAVQHLHSVRFCIVGFVEAKYSVSKKKVKVSNAK